MRCVTHWATAAGLALTLLWTGQFWSTERPGFAAVVIGLSSVILAASIALAAAMPLATSEPVPPSRLAQTKLPAESSLEMKTSSLGFAEVRL